MTMIEDAPTSAELTLDSAETYITPESLTPEELEGITAGLEAMFAHAVEEKRDFPHEMSVMICNAFGGTNSRRMTYTVNGGDGSQLTEFDPAFCYGIEPDEKLSRKRQGRYTSIVGTLPRVSKLMDGIGSELGNTITIFRDDTNVEETIDFLNANLRSYSDYAYVVTASRHEELLPTFKELPGVYAGIKTGAFTVWFGSDPDETRTVEEGRPELGIREATVDMLDLLGPWIQEQKAAHSHRTYPRHPDTHHSTVVKAAWQAIHREYGRRFIREAKVYDVELVGKKLIDFIPSDWAKLALEHHGLSNLSQRIHKRDVTYFAQQSGLWRELLIMEDEGFLLIDPLVKEAIAPVIEAAARATTPLRPLKPQERLGYLGMTSKIKCIVADEERDYKVGRYYRVTLRDEEYTKQFTKPEKTKQGHYLTVRKKRRYIHQRIQIDNHSFFDDDANDIEYILKHFHVEDPGNIRTRYPHLIEAEDKRIAAIQAQYLEPRGFKFKDYQARDLAAISVNDRGILAWQQGLGKTPGGIAFALNAMKKRGKDLPVLIICPQDLIPQWQSEAKKFYGIELKWIGRHKGQNGGGKKEVTLPDGSKVSVAGGAIKNLMEARQIAKDIKNGKAGYYITHYEALTMGGAKNLVKIEEPYTLRIEKEKNWVRPGYRTNKETGMREWYDGEWQEKEIEITTAQECPECHGEMFGMKHMTCNRVHNGRRCGWTRIIYRIPNIGQILSTTFRDGVIVVDEGTQIASARNSSEQNSSQKTKAVCGLRARHRLVMSGTPVKNFIAQAFWLLWWGIGNKSERFPYAYNGGKSEFAKDYTVLEWTFNEDTQNWANVREAGEVTNHTRLWAQLAAVLLRRVKEETGELIVKKETHVMFTPLGNLQREQMDAWLRNFPNFYAEKHPEDPKVKRRSHVSMAAMLGLDVKLNYASVLPKTDPDHEWTQVPVENYTPAALKALETTLALAKQGRRVLVGTDLKKATAWLANTLAEKGVRTRTMLKSDGSGDTLDPADRSKVIQEFQEGEIDVLISTQKAIRLGHNLDKGNAVVMFGLDWDYETFAQFTERVHRLTSEDPVDVYVVVSGKENLTLLGRKWDVIQDKAKGASMAIDGRLPEQHEDPVDVKSIVAEMIENGIPATGEEIHESSVRAAWARTPHIDAYKIPDGFDLKQAKPWVIDWNAANAALEQRLAIEQEYRDMWLPDPEGVKEFAQACQASVDTAICESLETFFAGATAPLPEVADDTSSTAGEISTESEETSSAGTDGEGSVGFESPTVTADDEQPTDSDATPTSEAPVEIEGQLTLGGESGQTGELPYEDAKTPTAPAPPSLDFKKQLIDAKELLDLGILDQAEFDDLKAALIAGLKAAA